MTKMCGFRWTQSLMHLRCLVVYLAGKKQYTYSYSYANAHWYTYIFFAGHCSNRNNDSYPQEEMLTKEKCPGETQCNYEHSHILWVASRLFLWRGVSTYNAACNSLMQISMCRAYMALVASSTLTHCGSPGSVGICFYAGLAI